MYKFRTQQDNFLFFNQIMQVISLSATTLFNLHITQA